MEIESQLDDAYYSLPEYNANTDSQGYIDGARCDVYSLKDDIERADKTGDVSGLIKFKKRMRRIKQKEWANRASEAAQWAITRNIYYKKKYI